MDQFVGILVFVIWIAFNIYSASRKSKQKREEAAKKKTGKTAAPKEEPKGFREIMEEIRKAAEASREEKQRPPVKPVESKKAPVKRERMETLSEREKKRHQSYDTFVEKQRKMQHDANPHHLEERIMEIEETTPKKRVKVNLDLRNIIISDAILNRPYK